MPTQNVGRSPSALFSEAIKATSDGQMSDACDAYLKFVDATLQHQIDSLIEASVVDVPETADSLRLARAAIRFVQARQYELGRWPERPSANSTTGSDARDSTEPMPPATHMSSRGIVGFMHVVLRPGWREIWDELFNDIRAAGLYEKTERLFVGVLGDDADAFEVQDAKLEVVYRGREIGEFEYPTLDCLHQFCRQHEGLVYYVHTKGIFSRDQFHTVDDWRRYLTYFIVGQHSECIRCLENGFDVAGVNWQLRPWPHFSGNFWWSTAGYIRTLPSPSVLRAGSDARRGAERWLGSQPNARVACLHQSLVNHYEKPYPIDRYGGYSPAIHQVTVGPAWQKASAWRGLENAMQEHLAPVRPISLVVELGVEYGYSLFSLARALPFAKVIGVDLYDEQPRSEQERMRALGGQAVIGSREAREWVQSHLDDFPNVQLLIESTATAANHVEHPIDVLHFDANQHYDDLARDFRIWEPKVRPGGCVMFHDVRSFPDDVGRFFQELPGRKSLVEHSCGLGFWYKPFAAGEGSAVRPINADLQHDCNCLLSILVPTLPSRDSSFRDLLAKLQQQVAESGLQDKVEILWFLDNKQHSVGVKRNALMDRASGRFVVFVDDDDDIDDVYVPILCRTIAEHTEIDCIGFVGELTWSGRHPEPTIYSLKYREPENREVATGYRVYLRPPQHVNPIRRDIAIRFPFPDISRGEDLVRSMELARSGALRREFFLGSRVLYRYAFDPSQTETQRVDIAGH